MKTEQVNFRTTEKTKLKLLQKSQEYNITLSDFVLGVAERECDLDILQVWVHAYIDFTIKRNRLDNGCVITHFKFEDGSDGWNVPPFKNCYESKKDLLDALQDVTDYTLPKFYVVLDYWSEFVHRLKLLGMWKEEVE